MRLLIQHLQGAAYDNSFYIFYTLNANTTAKNVTAYLNLLSSKVIANQNLTDFTPEPTRGSSTTNNNILLSTSIMSNLSKHLKWLTPESNITVLTDADIDNNSKIFKGDGNNAYDTIILGHQEYVTQKEYDNLKKFVANGGILFLMDGNTFYARVKYDTNTHTITLDKGHGWAFNGKSAWRSVNETWANETSQWVGSNYLCYSCDLRFTNNPFEYNHHEEQYITNPKAKILLDYNATLVAKSNIPKAYNTLKALHAPSPQIHH